ncbi:MAG: hypothetical protein PHT51_04635 [Patescibacteria group bacterium]|nr:hypothetical protein [Patescibacteria group bacterium]MDD4610973.1 hypothetical protein [Patescibacteria group bacterium]
MEKYAINPGDKVWAKTATDSGMVHALTVESVQMEKGRLAIQTERDPFHTVFGPEDLHTDEVKAYEAAIAALDKKISEMQERREALETQKRAITISKAA